MSVQKGLFTTQLDFGNVWNGADRFLEIQVGSTILAPRTKINPTPYAIRAGTANPIGSAGGDLVGTYPNPTVARLRGRAVLDANPLNGQVLKWDGSAWAPANDNNTTYSAGAGLALTGTTFSIASGGVVNSMLADGAVSSSKIADNAITTAKIANGAVTDPKIVSVSMSVSARVALLLDYM